MGWEAVVDPAGSSLHSTPRMHRRAQQIHQRGPFQPGFKPNKEVSSPSAERPEPPPAPRLQSRGTRGATGGYSPRRGRSFERPTYPQRATRSHSLDQLPYWEKRSKRSEDALSSSSSSVPVLLAAGEARAKAERRMLAAWERRVQGQVEAIVAENVAKVLSTYRQRRGRRNQRGLSNVRKSRSESPQGSIFELTTSSGLGGLSSVREEDESEEEVSISTGTIHVHQGPEANALDDLRAHIKGLQVEMRELASTHRKKMVQHLSDWQPKTREQQPCTRCLPQEKNSKRVDEPHDNLSKRQRSMRLQAQCRPPDRPEPISRTTQMCPSPRLQRPSTACESRQMLGVAQQVPAEPLQASAPLPPHHKPQPQPELPTQPMCQAMPAEASCKLPPPPPEHPPPQMPCEPPPPPQQKSRVPLNIANLTADSQSHLVPAKKQQTQSTQEQSLQFQPVQQMPSQTQSKVKLQAQAGAQPEPQSQSHPVHASLLWESQMYCASPRDAKRMFEVMPEKGVQRQPKMKQSYPRTFFVFSEQSEDGSEKSNSKKDKQVDIVRGRNLLAPKDSARTPLEDCTNRSAATSVFKKCVSG